jgi:hypothetical protein
MREYFFLAVANAQENAVDWKEGVMLDKIKAIIKKFGCYLNQQLCHKFEFEQVGQELSQGNYLDYNHDTETYKVKVEVFGRSLLKKHPLEEEIKSFSIQEILHNLKNNFGVIAVFLLDEQAQISSSYTENKSEELEVVCKMCSEEIGRLEDFAKDRQQDFLITEMQLFTQGQIVYVTKIETSKYNFLLCLVGEIDKMKIGPVRGQIETSTREALISALQS